MLARLHLEQDPAEDDEVSPLARLERVLDEEWDDAVEQVLLAPHPVRHPVSVVAADDAAAEEGLQGVQELHIALVLHDGELRQNLSACSQVRVRIHPDVEAAFAVDKACNPSCVELHWPAPNVWSLRVLAAAGEPSLRIVPVSAGL
jgi:hypothetical protein